uniref:Uncharacterized protein n=1 Tax=Arundo donax TaxID=35708 RepID=A0A0A9HQQ0_ARUDO
MNIQGIAAAAAEVLHFLFVLQLLSQARINQSHDSNSSC